MHKVGTGLLTFNVPMVKAARGSSGVTPLIFTGRKSGAS